MLLQWDRAFDSAEGLLIEGGKSREYVLQWDRAFDSAEGARSSGSTPCIPRFNGTAHLIARKAWSCSGSDMPDTTLLQWDRAFDSAEGLCRPA